jgi:membrane-associated phospholipid phosphatase
VAFPLRRLRGLGPLISLGFLGPLILFVALAEDVQERHSFEWDADTIAFVKEWALGTDTEHLAAVAGIAALIAGPVVLLWLFLLGRRRDAIFWTVAVGGGAALGRLLEEVFVRSPVSSHATGHTFPSGTATTMMAVVAGLTFLAQPIRVRVVLLSGLALLGAGAVLVASRSYYPSDVLAGWALAVTWVTGVWVTVLGIPEGYGLSAAATTNGRRAQRLLPQRRVTSTRPLRGRPGSMRVPRRRGAVGVARGATLEPVQDLTREKTISLVYIAGPSRSGSTLLDLILSQILGVVSTGELQYVWTRGVLENEPCGCGKAFRECPFWRAVGEEAFGGWHNLDVHEVIALQQDVVRLRHLPRLLASHPRPGFHEKLVAYATCMERLYLAVAGVSGSSVVVDSSKTPSSMLLLRWMSRVNPRVLHLVRDSRGVAFSWTKHMLRLPDSDTHMVRYRPVRGALGWVVLTLPVHLAGLVGLPRQLVRYESVLESPRAEVERILSFLEIKVDEDTLASLDQRSVELGANHTVSGNPARFRRGRIPLLLDTEWHTRMKTRDRAIVSLVTWPLQALYGYGSIRSLWRRVRRR